MPTGVYPRPPRQLCAIDGCERPRYARGLCATHYRSKRKASSLLCSIDGCEKPAFARGWCPAHYKRWRLYGDPLKIKDRSPRELRPTVGYHHIHIWINREFPRTNRCEYCGRRTRTHYASIGHQYTRNRTDWFELCPRCHNAFDGPPTPETIAKIKAATTGRTASAATRAKMHASSPRTQWTHCIHGHPFDAANTYINARGNRLCRACNRERKRAKAHGN